MLARLRARLQKDALRAWHHYSVSNVVRLAAPVTVGEEAYTVLSMISHSDIMPYLVAIKSFARYGSPRRVAVLCDDTVTAADRNILRLHIPHLELYAIAAFRRPEIPSGGCWERLLAVSELCKEQYVVQLDSDTVTTGEVGEVLNAVRRESGFLMGVEADQQIGSLVDLKQKTEGNAPRLAALHVHDVAEFHLARLGLDPTLRYAVGWAAFSGFPQDDTMQHRMLDVVGRMRTAIGRRFDDWGSEMVTSNFLVTNSNSCRILPHPKYCTPSNGERAVTLWHFVGSIRYSDSRYTNVSRRAVRGLTTANRSKTNDE